MKMQILSFENLKCKYFQKVLKMHLNANAFAFDPMSDQCSNFHKNKKKTSEGKHRTYIVESGHNVD